MAIHLCRNTVQEWSCVRRLLSACKKTPRKQDMSVVTSVSSELLLDSVLLLLQVKQMGGCLLQLSIIWLYGKPHAACSYDYILYSGDPRPSDYKLLGALEKAGYCMRPWPISL